MTPKADFPNTYGVDDFPVIIQDKDLAKDGRLVAQLIGLRGYRPDHLGQRHVRAVPLNPSRANPTTDAQRVQRANLQSRL